MFPVTPENMGMTSDDVAEQLAQQDEEQRIFEYGAQLAEGTSMCGGCLSPLAWDAEARVFLCTSSGCEYAN
jgi:hypothetical protein